MVERVLAAAVQRPLARPSQAETNCPGRVSGLSVTRPREKSRQKAIVRRQTQVVVCGRCCEVAIVGVLAMRAMPPVLEVHANRQVSTAARRREVIGPARVATVNGGHVLIAG